MTESLYNNRIGGNVVMPGTLIMKMLRVDTKTVLTCRLFSGDSPLCFSCLRIEDDGAMPVYAAFWLMAEVYVCQTRC